jgi:hypothetical protein
MRRATVGGIAALRRQLRGNPAAKSIVSPVDFIAAA